MSDSLPLLRYNLRTMNAHDRFDPLASAATPNARAAIASSITTTTKKG